MDVDEAFGEFALKMRLVSAEDLKTAKELARKEARSLARVLLDNGYMRDADIQMIHVALETTGVVRRNP